MRQRRYFRHRRGTPVVTARAPDSPRRPGLLLWLSGLAVLIYMAQLYAPTSKASDACERSNLSCLPEAGPAARI